MHRYETLPSRLATYIRNQELAFYSKLLLGFFVLLVIIGNYTGGTYLMGWDSLSTELNTSINLPRALEAAWQEYQGLGLQNGLAHASDLPRQIFVVILTWFLSNDLVRYVEHWIFMAVGVFGMYFFLRNFVLRKFGDKFRREIGATIGALFYLLNIATVQTFYLPLEVFTIHFAMLPWLFLYAFRYLKFHRRRDLFIFSILSILAATQAYTETLFIVYLIPLVSGTLIYLFSTRHFRKQLLHSVFLGIAVVMSNLFWVLPFARFAITNSQYVPESRINRFASEAGFLQNQEYGTVLDIILLRGFWFNNQNVTMGGDFTELMPEWKGHFELGVIQTIAVGFFALAILGAIIAIWKYNRVIGIWLLFIIFVGFVFLGAGNSPFGPIYELLRNNALLKEALRFPFTKFSILQGFMYSVGIAISITFFARIISSLRIAASLKYLLAILPIVFVISLYSFPSFQGFFISPFVRVSVPQEYFQMFNFFAKQPKETRIVYLPMNTHWGWTYHNWGYQGSGFIWFGIEQPIVDRAFDVWNPYNEQFYREFRFAYYTGEVTRIEEILRKYDITWLVWDKSKFIPGGYREESSLNYASLHNLLLKSDNIEFIQLFGENLEIYKYTGHGEQNSFVKAIKNAHSAGKADKWYDYDPLINYPYYNTTKAIEPELIAPFKENDPINYNYKFEIDEANQKIYLQDENLSKYKYERGPQTFTYTLEGKINQRLELTLKGIDSQNKTYTRTLDIRKPDNDFYLVVNDIVYGPFSRQELQNNQQILVQDIISDSRQEAITVRLYDRILVNSERKIQPKELNFLNCNNNYVNGEVDQEILSNGYKRVYAKGTFGCAYLSLFQWNFYDRSLLINTELSYKAEQDGLSICITSADGCVNELTSLTATDQYKNRVVNTEITRFSNNIGIQVNADDLNKDTSQNLVYFDIGEIKLKYFELVDKSEFVLRDDFSNSEYISERTGDRISIDLKKVVDLKLTPDEINTDVPCFIEDTLQKDENLRFKVEDTISCLYKDLENLDTNKTYLLAIDVYKHAGKAPEICLLDGQSNTCILFEQFNVEIDKWVRNYFIIPTQNISTNKGYYLLIYNWAAGIDPLDYSYRDLKIYTIPNNALGSVVAKDENVINANYEEFYELKTVHRNKYLYSVNINDAILKTHRYLVLNQSYDTGWYIVDGRLNWWSVVQALLGSKEASPNQSAIYKGWANIWDLNKLNTQNTLTIVYLPQYLIWFGWCLTLLWLVYLTYILSRTRKLESRS